MSLAAWSEIKRCKTHLGRRSAESEITERLGRIIHPVRHLAIVPKEHPLNDDLWSEPKPYPFADKQ